MPLAKGTCHRNIRCGVGSSVPNTQVQRPETAVQRVRHKPPKGSSEQCQAGEQVVPGVMAEPLLAGGRKGDSGCKEAHEANIQQLGK